MKILNLEEAAALLKMSPEGLRRKVVKGEIPGAKPGKCWCFIEEDLAEYLQSIYPSDVKASWGDIKPNRMTIRRSQNEVTPCGLISATIEKEYSEALGLATK
jgi:excisionase family DNA binding protein